MPRDRRSRGSKGVRSEEDRPLYLQQRAMAEAELNRKKQEILTHFLRDKLQDDEKNSAFNSLKVQDGWRSNLRQSKNTRMKNHLDSLEQTFERRVDALDSRILKTLPLTVEDVESQLQQLHSSHLQHIQTLLQLQRKRMDFLEHEWESTMETIGEKYAAQKEQAAAEVQRRYQDIEDNSLQIQHNYEELMKEVTAEYRQIMDFYENLYLDKISKLEKIPEERRREHQQLKEQHDIKKQELDSLLTENQTLLETKERSEADLQSLERKLLDLHTGGSSDERGLSAVEQQLEAIAAGISRVRTQTELSHRTSRGRLCVLSQDSDRAAKNLLHAVNAGERILCLDKLCKKLEEKHLITQELDPGDEETEEKEEPESWENPELRFFHRRQNAALLQQEALRRRRDALSRENERLHSRVQQLQRHQESLAVGGHRLTPGDTSRTRTMDTIQTTQSQSLAATTNSKVVISNF